MAIDLDILSFGEYNSNISDINSKLTGLWNALKNASSADNTKMLVKRGSYWVFEGEEVYNNRTVDLGNITGEIPVTLTNQMTYCAILGTVTGDVQISSFSGILTGVPYQMFLKQDATGGHTFRFPNGTSTMFAIDPAPNSITPVVFVKLPNGSLFAKFKSFASPVGIGLVSAMIGRPTITNPVGAALLSFTWTKSAAIGYGGTLTDLYSDWEIASDNLYSSLLFSSYLDTVHLSSIDVILAGGGTVYMRTRYGGKLDGVDMASEWASGVLQLGTFSGDEFWDQTVLCINANKYAWDGSRKIVDEKFKNKFTFSRDAKISAGVSNFWGVNFNGTADCLVSEDANIVNLDTCSSFTIELVFSLNVTGVRHVVINKDGNPNLSYSQYSMEVEADNRILIGTGNGAGVNPTYESSKGNTVLTSGVLYHVAIVLDNGVIKTYLNGVLECQHVRTYMYSTTTKYLHFGAFMNTTYYMNGKIYSARITKNVARYSSNFSVDLTKPYFETGNLWWTPEPKEISTTNFSDKDIWDKVYHCLNFYGVSGSVVFTDLSTVPYSVTAAGNAQVSVSSDQAFLLLGGAGDYLTFPTNFNPNISGWVIDVLIYITSFADGNSIFHMVSGSYKGLHIWVNTSGFLVVDNGTTATTVGNIQIVVNTFTHVTVKNISGIIYGYVNGVQCLTHTAQVYTIPTVCYVGRYYTLPVYDFTGRIYALKISQGETSPANFTPKTSANPYFITKPKVENWAETSLLINALGLPVGSTDIRDFKGNAVSLYGDTKVAVDSNGLEYINFDGTGDYLTSPTGAHLNFGTDPFTFEAFVSLNALPGNLKFPSIFTRGNGSGVATQWSLAFSQNGTGITFNVFNGSTWLDCGPSYSTTLTINTLYHVALVRVGIGATDIKLFLNGVLVASSVSNPSLEVNNADKPLTMGYNSADYGNFRTYSARITKGKALYTSNFAVDLTNPYFPARETCVDIWVDPSERKNTIITTGISDIKERSGNDLHFTQATAVYQPSLMSSYANGLPAMDFDGTTKFMLLPASAFPKPKEWLVVCLVNLQNVSGSRSILGQGDSAGASVTSAVTISIFSGYPNKLLYQFGNDSVSSYGYCNATMAIDTDYLIGQSHKEGTSFVDYFLQGDKQTITQTLSGSTTCSGTPYMFTIGAIGEYTGSPIDGQIADIVIVKYPATDYFRIMIEGFIAKKYNKTGLLSAGHKFKNFFPTEDKLTDPYASNVVLCLNANEQYRQDMYFDSAKKNKITKSGSVNVACGTDNKPYFNFDGTANCALVLPSNNLLFGVRDVTVEFFIEITGYNANEARLLNADGDIYHEISIAVESNGMLTIYASSNGTSWNMVAAPSVFQTSLNTLYHFAVVRHGGNLYFFVNGVKSVISSTLGTTVLTPSNPKRSIGGQSNGVNRSLNGKIYSYRITDGVARYTSDFTPDMSNPYFACSVPNFYNPEKYLLKAWYDSYDTAFIKTTGALVEKLIDKSGNGVDLVPDVPSARPTLSTNAITFTTNMLGKSGLNIDINSYCIIGVFSSSATGGISAGFVNVSSYNKEDPELRLGIGEYDKIYADSGYKINVDGLSTARHLKAVDFGTSATTLYNEGNVVATASVSSLSVLDYIKIGYFSAANGTFSGYRNGVLHELLICHTSIRQKIEGYLAHKWDYLLGSTALKDALPVNHPYKSTGPV